MTDELTSEQRQLLLEKVIDVNDTLVTQSINVAGQAFTNAFKLGCSLLFVPVLLLLGISYWMGKFSLISIFVYFGLGALLAMVFAQLVSTRAKTLAILDDAGPSVDEEIAVQLQGSEFNRTQFDALAVEALGEDSPLRIYLRKPVEKKTS